MNVFHFNNAVDEWLNSRPWKSFLWSLPVLLGSLGVAVIMIVIVIQQPASLADHYTRVIKRDLGLGQFEEARVAALRGYAMAKNEVDRDLMAFYLSLAVSGLGQKTEALALLQVAAPLDHPGSPDAHMFLAQKILSSTNISEAAYALAAKNSTNPIVAPLKTAERHLLNALTRNPKSVYANELLSRLYLKTGRVAQAREHLLRIYGEKPSVALLLAFCANAETNEAETVTWSDRAINALEHNLLITAPNYNPLDRFGLLQALSLKAKYTKNLPELPPDDLFAEENQALATNSLDKLAPQDSPQLWLDIVKFLIYNGKYSEALQTLQQQLAMKPNPVYAQAIGDLCAAWAAGIAGSQPGATSMRLSLIQQGLTNAPENLALHFQLIQAAQAADETSQTANTLLANLMRGAKGASLGLWHFALWGDTRIRGDMAEARKHLRLAYQLDPKNPQICNDLAMDLLAGSPADQQKALSLIQPLVDANPYDVVYRDTRGQILAALGRDREALVDLEYAVGHLNDPSDTRRVLAKVDARLGIVPPKASPKILLRARDLINASQYSQALALLNKEQAASPDPAYSTAIADACMLWAEHIGERDHQQRLALIQQGLLQEPRNRALQKMLVLEAHVPGEPGRNAKKALDQLIVSSTGETIIQWYLSVGQDAFLHKDLLAARLNFEKALALAPQRSEIQIELAKVYAAGGIGDQNRALDLIQSVVLQFPTNPEFKFTRGKILVQMGRFKDAEPDLVVAEKEWTDNRETHQLLARVYEALGKAKLADRERRLAMVAQ